MSDKVTTQDTVTGRIGRKYMAHLIDANFGESTPNYSRLGRDLEEYTVELNPDTETSKNILGESTFRHNGNERSADADPFYAIVGDPLFEKLQKFVDEDVTDDRLKSTTLEIHLWDGSEAEGFVAWSQACYVVPTSYGGDTSGYQIPFTVNYVGGRTKGIWNPETNTFTPSEGSALS